MLSPPPQLTVSQRAECHRILGSRASSEPSLWRISRTREAAIHDLVRWSARKLPMFSLVHVTNVWARKHSLMHAARMDGRALAVGVRPARYDL